MIVYHIFMRMHECMYTCVPMYVWTYTQHTQYINTHISNIPVVPSSFLFNTAYSGTGTPASFSFLCMIRLLKVKEIT